MNGSKYKGTLKTWKDDRGFGFIKSENGTEEIFVHISAIQNKSRRPQVGDVLYYQKNTENGKIRASNVFIEGLPVTTQTKARNKQMSRKRGRSNFSGSMRYVVIIVFIVISAIQLLKNPSSIMALIPKPGCKIKGNISITSGRKIYHVPGQEDYESTNIYTSKGERWFCTESEAIENGWTKAPR